MVASVPLVPTFVRACAAKGYERQNRDTRGEGDMRCVLRCVVGTFVIVGLIIAGLVAPASAALPGRFEFSSVEAVSKWISIYRSKPDPPPRPAAGKVRSPLGAVTN